MEILKQKRVRLILIVTLSILLTLLISILVNILTSQESPLAHLPAWLIIIFLFIVVALLISVTVYDRLPSSSAPEVASPNQEQAEKNRERLLERVRDKWIKGVLDDSLYREARIELGLSKYPEALANPFHLSLWQGQRQEKLPTGTRIIEVYDNAKGELLILGKPGSGKTTLLLELLQTLLRRAVRDKSHPLPVVFSLSSWAVSQPPLTEWFVEELYMKYQVPRSLGRAWINEDQILPLLDGLDEVPHSLLLSCVEAINTYRRDHGSVSTGVCCRTDDYFDQANRLQLQNAVEVLPLEAQQVDEYLSTLGEQVTAIRETLHNDPDLYELVSTPLMLSILILAYKDQPIEAGILTGSKETQRDEIFKTYVQRMLERQRTSKSYSPKQTHLWLHWLAGQMASHNQREFYLEEMQPDWCPRVWIFRLLSILLYGLGFGLIFGLFVGLVFGLFGGLFFGLFGGLFGGLFFGLGTEIHPAEIVVWSWTDFRRSLLSNLVVALFFALALWLVVGLIVGLARGLLSGLFFGLGFGLFVALGLGLFDGLKGGALEKSTRFTPNQGIRRSRQNGMIYGLIVGLIFGMIVVLGLGLFFGLVFGQRYGLIFGLFFGLLGGLVFGLFFGLFFGGYAYLQHGILRLLLWQAGYAPLRYVYFLDCATKHILLRKVGGGYIFIHRLLQDYFASLEPEPTPQPETPQTQNAPSAP
jgi:hypothetical protein